MTTFKATVKKPRSDGFYTVYIRVTHQRKTSYIKTNKIIDPAHITSSGELTLCHNHTPIYRQTESC